MVRNIFFQPILMEKRTVQKRTHTLVDMDDAPTKPDGSTLMSRVPHHIRRKRKRNDMDNIDGLRKKQSKGVNTVEEEVKPVDRISELPESVIHHILSFIRSGKEAARTSILSKNWRDAWKSFSILTFDERLLKTDANRKSDNQTKMLIDFIDNSLQSHLEQNLPIYKLVLRITPELVLYVNQWVSIAARNGLRELDLQIEDKRLIRYNLPPLMCSAQTLTGLRLHGLNYASFVGMNFKNLQKLYLRRLHVDQQMIQTLVSTCPSIMDLRIVECRGLKTLKISGFLKLDRVDLHRCHGLRKIELQVANLQTFWYCAKKSARCKINLESCSSLKRLTLEDPCMTDTFLNKLLLSFPVLEKLDLSRCNKFVCITIASLQLKRLVLRSCKNLKIVDNHTPNLCSFDYKGNAMVLFLGQLCLNEAKISLDSTGEEVVGIQCRNFVIKSFLQTHCRGFNIIVWFRKNVIIHDDSEEIILPRLPNLKLQVIKSSTKARDLLDGLLTAWHPETLLIVSSPNSNFHISQAHAVDGIKREVDPSCCRYNASNNKCWRHFLEDAKIVNFEETEDASSAWFRDLNLQNAKDQITYVRLHWEPSVHIRKA